MAVASSHRTPFAVFWPHAIALAAAAESVTGLSLEWVRQSAVYGSVSMRSRPPDPPRATRVTVTYACPIPSPMNRTALRGVGPARPDSGMAGAPVRAAHTTATAPTAVNASAARPRDNDRRPPGMTAIDASLDAAQDQPDAQRTGRGE